MRLFLHSLRGHVSKHYWRIRMELLREEPREKKDLMTLPSHKNQPETSVLVVHCQTEQNARVS